jgi:hypothetical protein
MTTANHRALSSHIRKPFLITLRLIHEENVPQFFLLMWLLFVNHNKSKGDNKGAIIRVVLFASVAIPRKSGVVLLIYP